MRRYRYLLGDSRRESARLRHQARIWDPTALALFDRLKVKRRWRVLEIGPGQGSLHMELRRRIRGPVDAVEPSSAFADEPPEWDNFLEADGAFFESQGGDVNIGARLPLLYERAGLHVTDITSTTKVGRPGSAEWKWLTTYFLGVLSRYADFR